MNVSLLLPAPACLQLETCVFDETAHTLTLTLTSTQDTPRSPIWRPCAPRPLRHYTPPLAYLAGAEFPTHLLVLLPKPFCPPPVREPIFSPERFPPLVPPYARRTIRLATAQRRIGF